jgi:hypothetical protein
MFNSNELKNLDSKLEDCVGSFAKKIDVYYTNDHLIYEHLKISPFGRKFYADRNLEGFYSPS